MACDNSMESRIYSSAKCRNHGVNLLRNMHQLAEEQNEEKVIRVSRSKLMYHSHIHTLPTFHKYFKELQDFGYMEYTPSYHPGFRSVLSLCILDC